MFFGPQFRKLHISFAEVYSFCWHEVTILSFRNSKILKNLKNTRFWNPSPQLKCWKLMLRRQNSRVPKYKKYKTHENPTKNTEGLRLLVYNDTCNSFGHLAVRSKICNPILNLPYLLASIWCQDSSSTKGPTTCMIGELPEEHGLTQDSLTTL